MQRCIFTTMSGTHLVRRNIEDIRVVIECLHGACIRSAPNPFSMSTERILRNQKPLPDLVTKEQCRQ